QPGTYPPPQPGTYSPPAPQPPGTYPPAAYPAPAPAPYGAAAQQPRVLRHGLTFEANLGIGWIHLSTEEVSDFSEDAGLAGLSLGVGGWVGTQTAITARLAGVTLSDRDLRLSQIFLGPSAQFWMNDNLWL